jgi:hypothetical protein
VGKMIMIGTISQKLVMACSFLFIVFVHPFF